MRVRRSKYTLLVLLVVFRHLHSKPLCQELSDIVYGGKCERLGDQLYECRELTRMPGKWSTGYGKCITDNKMDVFQVRTKLQALV